MQLYDYGARCAARKPALARFIQPDSVVPNPANPQTLNPLALHNPLK